MPAPSSSKILIRNMRPPWIISVPIAFLATDNIFTQSKNASITVTIHDFALPDHIVLEGRIIRCSDDNGLFIVGCQMPEDNFYILEYVEKNLESKK